MGGIFKKNTGWMRKNWVYRATLKPIDLQREDGHRADAPVRFATHTIPVYWGWGPEGFKITGSSDLKVLR